MPADKERLPGTLERSAAKVRRAYPQTAGAREADIEGRSSMTKAELVDALKKHHDRETAKARCRR